MTQSRQEYHSLFSPGTASTALSLGGEPESIIAIAQGLIATIHKRNHIAQEDCEQYQRERNLQGKALQEQREEIEVLNSRLVDYTARLPRISCPPGYTINRDGRCPSFLLPANANLWVLAHWVQMHQDGRSGRPHTNGPPEDVCYVADLFVQMPPGRTRRRGTPVLPLGPGLFQMLKGPAILYGPLLEVVRETGDWALQAEVQRFQSDRAQPSWTATGDWSSSKRNKRGFASVRRACMGTPQDGTPPLSSLRPARLHRSGSPAPSSPTVPIQALGEDT